MREGTIRFVCTRRLQSSDFASTKEDKEQNRIGQMCDESYSDALGDCQIKWLSISDSVLNEVVRMDEQRLDESCICIDDLVQSCRRDTWESGVRLVFPLIIVCLTAHPHEFLFFATSNRLVMGSSVNTAKYAVYPTTALCCCFVPRRTERLSAPPWGIGYEGCDLRFIFQGLFPLV